MSMDKVRHTRLRQLIIRHLVQTRSSIALAALCLLGALLMELLAPWPLKLIFDQVLMGKPLGPSWSYLGALFQWGPLPAVAILSASVFLMVVVGGAFSYGQVYLVTKSGYQLAAKLKTQLFSHLQRLSLGFHTQASSGDLVVKMASDTTAIRDLFTDWGVRALYQSLVIGGMLVVMTVVNWQLALVVLGSVPVLFIALARLNRKIRASITRQRKQEGRIASRMNEVLSAIAMVQAFARREFEDDRFEREAARNLAEGITSARTAAVVTRVIEVVCAFSTAVTLLFGSWQAFKGYMTPGDLLIFVSYLRSIYKPIRDLGKASIRVSRASVCAGRIEEVLAIEEEPRDAPNAIAAANLTGDIVFRNVSFGYDGRHQLLDDVSFHIHPGQKVVLVGASGTGKSSLIGLILRLYEPQHGAIMIDRVDVRDYQRESLRRSIGLVLQDSVLFAVSIRENIAYGRPEAGFDAIEAAARHAHAHDFIMALPDGYDTTVGERGCTLSGGQRQRICLARALIKQPSILILDEPTSAVDPTSASMIHDAIDRVQAGKTVLIISHQISRDSDFDQILTLRDRKICVSAPPEHRVRLRGAT
jgi:ATP-binding cassette subfamily B protein